MLILASDYIGIKEKFESHWYIAFNTFLISFVFIYETLFNNKESEITYYGNFE